MRILFFLNNVSKTRHFDSVIHLLADRGHTIVLAAARQRNRPLTLPKNLSRVNDVLIGKRAPGRIEVTACPTGRVDRWQRLAPAIRQARDYLRFFDDRYSHADKLEQRSAMHVPKGWLRLLRDHGWLARRWRLPRQAQTFVSGFRRPVSTLIPGPIVDDTVIFLRYLPLAEAGFAR